MGILVQQVQAVKMRTKELAIAIELLGDYLADRNFGRCSNNWLHTVWTEKDRLIETLSPLPGYVLMVAKEA